MPGIGKYSKGGESLKGKERQMPESNVFLWYLKCKKTSPTPLCYPGSFPGNRGRRVGVYPKTQKTIYFAGGNFPPTLRPHKNIWLTKSFEFLEATLTYTYLCTYDYI